MRVKVERGGFGAKDPLLAARPGRKRDRSARTNPHKNKIEGKNPKEKIV